MSRHRRSTEFPAKLGQTRAFERAFRPVTALIVVKDVLAIARSLPPETPQVKAAFSPPPRAKRVGRGWGVGGTSAENKLQTHHPGSQSHAIESRPSAPLRGGRERKEQKRPPLAERPHRLGGKPASSLVRRRLRRMIAPLGHELVELGLVLGHAQAIEEVAELALLVLEPAQGLGAIFVEGPIAARGIMRPRRAAAHLRAHPVHLALHALHLVLPAVVAAVVITASHASAPYREGEDCETQRPEGPEAEDDQRDPGGFAEFVELGGDGHGQPRVNVNSIYIYGGVHGECQHPLHSDKRAGRAGKGPAARGPRRRPRACSAIHWSRLRIRQPRAAKKFQPRPLAAGPVTPRPRR